MSITQLVHEFPVLTSLTIIPYADLDFNGTAQTLELVGNLSSLTATLSISVYNDGEREEEEGFVVLIGVSEEELDQRDVGYVEVLNPTVLVRVLDSGESVSLVGACSCEPT